MSYLSEVEGEGRHLKWFHTGAVAHVYPWMHTETYRCHTLIHINTYYTHMRRKEMRRRQKEKEEGEEKVGVDKGSLPAPSEEKGAQPGTSSLGKWSLADRVECLQKQDFEGWFKNTSLCRVCYWFQTDLNLSERKVVTTSLWPFLTNPGLLWPRPSSTVLCSKSDR